MKLLQLNPRSTKVCFNINTSVCNGEAVTEMDRFSIGVVKENCESKSVLLTYTSFVLNDEQAMCINLGDKKIKDLCPGRYLFRVILDECVVADDVRFQWSKAPIVFKTCVESHDGVCDHNCSGACKNESTSLLAESCCECECEEDSDPCDRSGNCDCKGRCPDPRCFTRESDRSLIWHLKH